MARLGDSEAPGRSEPEQAAGETPQSVASPVQNRSTLEGLLSPIVIVNRQGNICFMNLAARQLLAEGLDRRLAAHIRSNPAMGPLTQVRFKLQNGHDLILKVRLGEIEWLGEKAVQISIANVTPYLVMIQELQKELGKQKQAREELAAAREGAERAVSEGRAREADSGRVAEKLTAQVAALQSELSAGAAEREELRRQIAALRQDLAAAEQARSEWAKMSEVLKGDAQGHADALARARAEAAEAARFAEALQTKAAEAEKQAASTALELERVRGELSHRMDEAQAAEKAWSQERAELQRGARDGMNEASAQSAEELLSLRLKLAMGVHASRLAQEKIAQLEREVAVYRRIFENPAALREAQEQLAKRAQELAVADEQSRNLAGGSRPPVS